MEEIEEAIKELPYNEYVLLNRYTFGNEMLIDIAKDLGMNLNTAKTTIRRARKKMRARFDEYIDRNEIYSQLK